MAAAATAKARHLANLGRVWRLLEPGSLFKRYPVWLGGGGKRGAYRPPDDRERHRVGRRVRDFLPRPGGMPGNLVSDEAQEKFRGYFRYGGFSEERDGRVAKRLCRLETMDDLSGLLD